MKAHATLNYIIASRLTVINHCRIKKERLISKENMR